MSRLRWNRRRGERGLCGMSRNRALHRESGGSARMMARIPIGAVLLLALGGMMQQAGAAPPVTKVAAPGFNRDIRAILIENCFTCHGQDRGKRMAGLRLDVREEALAHGAIVPGKPDKS